MFLPPDSCERPEKDVRLEPEAKGGFSGKAFSGIEGENAQVAPALDEDIVVPVAVHVAKDDFVRLVADFEFGGTVRGILEEKGRNQPDHRSILGVPKSGFK